jgi:Bacterial Ig-like domain (group 1)
MNFSRKSIALPLFALALALPGCNSAEAGGPPVPSGIAALSGDGQFANVGASAANPLVVVVSDQDGNALPNATVTWQVTSGGGTVADTTSTTDASGIARTTYTAGPRPGAASIVATAAGLWTTSFTIYIEASGS